MAKFKKPYETFDHTADIGLRVRGKDFTQILRHSALGFFDLLTDVAALETAPPIEMTFRLNAENAEALLMLWLKELLFRFSTKRSVFWDFEFLKVTETECEVVARGAAFDPHRHESRREVKAVTYHEFECKKTQQGWKAQIIFDI